MVENTLITVPFLLDFTHFEFDKAVIFLVAVLLAVTVNAEAQAFAATVLGDVRKSPRDRFHFNPLLHLSLSGTLCFLVAGFGWPGKIEIDRRRLRHRDFYPLLIRLAGPVANLILAGVAGSILWIMTKWQLEDQVFSIVVAVNLMVFVFNLLPFPPLAGAAVFTFLFPDRIKKSRTAEIMAMVSPYLVPALMLSLRLKDISLLTQYMDPAVRALYTFISGG